MVLLGETMGLQRVEAVALPAHPGLWCAPLDEEFADLLVGRTLDGNDSRLREMTKDLDRFSSHERLEHWWENRQVRCLVDAELSLLGVTWIGPRPMPERDDYFEPAWIAEHGPSQTWALRMYGALRGQGLAAAFAETAFDSFAGGAGRLPLWASTKAVNGAARNLALRVGFREVSGEADGRIVYVRSGR